MINVHLLKSYQSEFSSLIFLIYDENNAKSNNSKAFIMFNNVLKISFKGNEKLR